ncbi:MAG: AAA family ATPase [Acidobacteria bacterium]|nr:AAA family ATPase [Acidobacteriota bacterium]
MDQNNNENVSPVSPLAPEALYNSCDPDQFEFETTAEIRDLTELIGQSRAVEAVEFGTGMRHKGYNLYALGPAGLGRHTFVRQFIEQRAAGEPAPCDWCYVNNFAQPQRPLALCLPSGQGNILRQDIEQLLEELRAAIPAVFESDDYRAKKQKNETETGAKTETSLEALRVEAEKKNIALLQTPTGFIFAPIKDGDVINAEAFEKLTDQEKNSFETDSTLFQEKLQTIIREIPRAMKEGREKLKQLDREVTTFAVDHLIDELREKYQSLAEVMSFLDALQQDVIANVGDFLNQQESPAGMMPGVGQSPASRSAMFLRRYQVNVLVDNETCNGAPVIYEDHPTLRNLIGQVEYMAQLGALVTDFNLIRPGALHRANGGYLILDAHKVLWQPYVWEGLKRALRSGEIRIESLGEMMGLTSTVSLEPKPIPLEIKVVLIGDRWLYYWLCHYDDEFSELFKVAADFEEDIERTPENYQMYARLIGTIARREELLPLDREAVSRVIEHSSRVADDGKKLSTHLRTLSDLLHEADYYAKSDQHQTLTASHIQRAIDAQTRRSDRFRQQLYQDIQSGLLLIDTRGEQIGQINGLSVIQLDNFSFGRPVRITARVRLGEGQVIDIEREVELGGPIHSKGVLILSGFLGSRYAADRPLSLSASLVFEQSYGGTEGDSASLAALCALLSALAEIPIKQSLAVTGSINQMGQVQAIGGVNEKIEGFFDICHARNLTGEQGVIIPAANVRHLMLRQDVVQAVREGKFNIWPVTTVDECMEILTGMPGGEKDASGEFPIGSINHRVNSKLVEMAEKREASVKDEKSEGEIE